MDLTCYVYEDWAPRIRPASARRQWMDDTSDSYAYRCLPLSIANAHGWEMLSPCGFEARWRGGTHADAVEIRLDAGAAPRLPPVSLFGNGTMTFHVEGLFRTPPGWNLWIGGSPNAAKDGIAPLGGVIETDWAPYTFTMNWRFTRANQWVRFEENEPFCFFFPVQRGPLLEMAPQIRPVEEAPELKAAFDGWSKARADFQAWVREAQPTAPADQWQKLYYRGVHPDGTPGPADHNAKLRLQPFRLPDGKPMEPPAPRCPVAPPPPAASPAVQSSPPRPAIFRDAGAAPRETGLIPPDVLQLTLSQIGFPAETSANVSPKASPPRQPAAKAAAARPAPAPRPAAPVDWAAALAAQQRLAPAVPRVGLEAADTFLATFYAPARPAILTGLIADWPALARWTPDYLTQLLGKAKITFQGGRNADPDHARHPDRHRRTLPFDRLLRLMLADGDDAVVTPENAAANAAAFAPLRADIGAPAALLANAAGAIALGGAGSRTPLHRQPANRIEAQLAGTRRITLLPPAEPLARDAGLLADTPALTTHPHAAKATVHRLTLAPGDLLFVPLGWWLEAEAEDFVATLTCRDFEWPNGASV